MIRRLILALICVTGLVILGPTSAEASTAYITVCNYSSSDQSIRVFSTSTTVSYTLQPYGCSGSMYNFNDTVRIDPEYPSFCCLGDVDSFKLRKWISGHIYPWGSCHVGEAVYNPTNEARVDIVNYENDSNC
jgi:hypothetical protein